MKIFVYKQPHYPFKELKESTEEKKAEIQQHYDQAIKEYSLYYFCSALIIGFLALVCGFLLKLDFLGAGFALGGIFTIILGLLDYWSYLNNFLKLAALLIAFIILITSAYFLVERPRK
jgi:hypothetical protein